jgi:hypothetical protein
VKRVRATIRLLPPAYRRRLPEPAVTGRGVWLIGARGRPNTTVAEKA